MRHVRRKMSYVEELVLFRHTLPVTSFVILKGELKELSCPSFSGGISRCWNSHFFPEYCATLMSAYNLNVSALLVVGHDYSRHLYLVFFQYSSNITVILFKLPGGLLFKTASHTLIFRMNALSSCSTCDSNASELQHQKHTQIMDGPFGTIPLRRRKTNSDHSTHTLLTEVSVGRSQTQISRLGDAPCPWWQQPLSPHHSEENDIGEPQMTGVIQFPRLNHRTGYCLTFSMSGFMQWSVSWIYWFSSGWHDIYE